jgi:hypothetical protein
MNMSHMLVPARATVATLVALMISVVLVTPASADVTGATSTTTTTADAGETEPLAGLSVSADDAAEIVSVIVSTDVGSLAVNLSGTSATIDFGYSASGSEVAFTGTRADINVVLATVTLTTPESAKGSDAEISIVARSAASTVYSPSTGHFYEYVPSLGITWTDARAAAQTQSYGGQQGYLATVPNAEVNNLIASRIEGASNVWFGGEAIDDEDGYARVWEWVDGPRAGDHFTRCLNNAFSQVCSFTDMDGLFSNWAGGEPNNFGTGEWYPVTNYSGTIGQWNDFPNNPAGITGYVVEYGDALTGAVGGFDGLFEASSTVALVGVPDPVTSLAASAGQSDATISWDAPVNDGGSAITDYTVTISPADGDTTDCTGTGTSCTITGLTPGTEYTVTVVAVNTHGDSETRTTTVTPVAAPGVPTGPLEQVLVGEPYSDFVTSEGFPAPTFAVTGGALPAGLSLNETTGEISGTPAETGPWSVQITATNDTGSASSTFSGVAGQVPAVTTTEVGPFTWGVPVDMYLTADGFPIPTWSATAVPPGLTLDADGRLHGTPTAGGDHSLTVTATNTHGSDSETFSVVVTPVVAGPPIITDITPGNGTLTVSVEAPDGNGGAAITGYEYTLDGGVTWVAATLIDGEFVISGLTNGAEYTVQVRAITAVGAGAASEPVSITLVLAEAGSGEGELSNTGADLRLVGVVAMLLIAGLGLVLVARRRREGAVTA